MRLTLLTAAFGALLPIAGQAADFGFLEFTIPGATSVSVNAVNDGGEAAGKFVSAKYPRGTAFIGTLAHIQALPDPEKAGMATISFNPSGINDYHTVIGTYLSDKPYVQVYTWHAGKYTYEGGFGVDESFLIPPFIDDTNHISYNSSQGAGAGSVSYAGIVSHQTAISVGGFPEVTSVNSHLQVAGQYQTVAGSNYTNAVFLGTLKHVDPILPSNGLASFGGWLNAAGQLAGSYVDGMAGWHGFIYQAGSYTSFDMPTVPTTLTVQGIDAAGSVVGIYSDVVGQHGFIAAHGTVIPLGVFPIADVVHVGISPAGRFVAISYDDGKVVRSLIGDCKIAAGC